MIFDGLETDSKLSSYHEIQYEDILDIWSYKSKKSKKESRNETPRTPAQHLVCLLLGLSWVWPPQPLVLSSSLATYCRGVSATDLSRGLAPNLHSWMLSARHLVPHSKTKHHEVSNGVDILESWETSEDWPPKIQEWHETVLDWDMFAPIIYLVLSLRPS